MDDVDRSLVNLLQDGIEVTVRPYRGIAAQLGLDEDEVVERIGRMLERGELTRFGPMYDAEKMGGSFSLCAMQVPEPDFERVAEKVNAITAVAHNYRREHVLNMWFVVATGQAEELPAVLQQIENCTGLSVLNMPKLEEYYVGLRLDAGAST